MATVLITGTSKGIGLITAVTLARAGHTVYATMRNPARAPELAQQAAQESLPIHVSVMDVDSDLSVANAIAAIYQAAGNLDVLVNNAGVAPRQRADLLEASEESFDNLIAINLKAPYFLTQAVARRMILRRQAEPAFRGCVVNVSSVSATVASVNRGDYCVSKAGLAMASKLWAARLAEFGIDVYEVRPGVVATDMTAGVKEKYDALIAAGLTVEKRWGQPSDVGKAVAMLARGELSYATGQVLTIDGGLTLERL